MPGLQYGTDNTVTQGTYYCTPYNKPHLVRTELHPSPPPHLPNHTPILTLVADDNYTRLQVLQSSQHAPMLQFAPQHHTLPVFINKCPTRCNNMQTIFHFTAISLYIVYISPTHALYIKNTTQAH